MEGLPVPYGASLQISGTYPDGGGTKQYDTAADVNLKAVHDWYAANLPAGQPWHDWQPCPAPPPGVTIGIAKKDSTTRTWFKSGEILVLSADTHRSGPGVRVFVAEFKPGPSPVEGAPIC
jgi:hypothetical protein